jgi:minor fimbrial subunit
MVTVPQSCTLDAGQTISIDLGNVYANRFVSAGVGNKPTDFNPVSKNIAIKCKGNDATANLTLRLQAEPASKNSNAIKTTNSDIGVVMTDSNNNTLIPNNTSSVIPFTLNNSQSNVTIKAYPVSLTGKTPAPGVFSALGYLRVDFD